MSEIDQLRRNVRVMDLLTRSWEAHSRGDVAACDRLIEEALEADADVVSVLRGGMMIGEVPRPEKDWDAWLEYAESARDKLALAEDGDDVVTGVSGQEYVIGELIASWNDPATPCDYPDPGRVSQLDGRCRCTICARCGHHTGNSNQGHYWSMCGATGAMREPHFCCPEPDGCELKASHA